MTNLVLIAPKFLIIRTDFLGDGVLSSPFIKMLQNATKASIDVLCYEYNYPSFQYNPYIANIFCAKFNDAKHKSICLPDKILLNSYDAIFILNRDRITYKFANKISAKFIFCYKLSHSSLRFILLTCFMRLSCRHKCIDYNNEIHEVENTYKLLSFALKVLGFTTTIALEDKSYFYTDSFNPERCFGKQYYDTVVLNISGRVDSNKYIPNNLAIDIILRLLADGGGTRQILLVATSADISRANHIISYVSDSRVTLCCEDDLFKLVNQIDKFKYFISADGGLVHIAAGLQMSCVVLFDKQSVNMWHPWTKAQVSLQAVTKSLSDISAKEVTNALDNLKQQGHNK